MEDYVLNQVFDERLKRVDDENNRQNHRLDLLEKNSNSLNDLVVSVRELALSVKQMQEELKRQGDRLTEIEKEPADNWKKLTWLVITGIVGAVVGFALSKLGL